MTYHFAAVAALALALPSLALAQTPAAGPQFAKIFTDHAVLQRGAPIHVWGTAPAGDPVTVAFNGQSLSATADAAGHWSASLATQTAGGPYSLSVSDTGGTTTLNDIMVGDVFLCSGQSNMQFPLNLATGAWGSSSTWANNNIRFLTIGNDSEPSPLGDIGKPAAWKVATPDTAGDASAVCYDMSSDLQKDQGIPIGFIGSYWGGTTIQGWISAPSLRTVGTYNAGLDAVALYAQSPAKAQAAQNEKDEAWWDQNDPDAANERKWAAPGFDDSAWASLTPVGSWKDAGVPALKDFDGVVWFRITVTLTDAQAKTANELQLGPIDTYDSTWINGVWAGSGGISWVWRDYNIPSGVFKAGKNVIVLRVLGSGGLTGNPQFRAVKTSDGQVITLPQSWKYKAGMPAKGLTIPQAAWAVPASLSTLYDGMIAPLAGYNIKLAAWYQGESNADAGKEYQTLLPLMMADWRKAWGQPDLPFLIVQLPGYGSAADKPGQSNWADLREAQRLTVDRDPHAALAVTIDVGDRANIHPTEKSVVADRLARAARALVYGEAATPGGPEATGVTRSGNDLVVAFKDTNGGLKTYSGAVAIGFEACTAADACTYATGVANGDSVTLTGANRPGVTSVRYAWADAPYTNLYSSDDIPAMPFEMDIQP